MNPSPVIRALNPVTEKVGGIELPPFKLSHHLALEAIGSPIVKGQNPESFGDIIRAIAIMSLPGPKARELASSPSALDARVTELAEAIPPYDIRPLAEAAARQVARAFDTALATKAPEGESVSA